MLDRRGFLAAAAGASVLPMPAIARAAPTAKVIATRDLGSSVADSKGNVIYPTLMRTPGGSLAAAWYTFMDRGPHWSAFLQLFSPDLVPRSLPLRVTRLGIRVAVAMSPRGGLVVASAPDTGLRPVTTGGAATGPLVRAVPKDSKLTFIDPVICPRADGRFLAAWTAYSRNSLTSGGFNGLRAAVFEADGRRCTRFFDLFPLLSSDVHEAVMAPLALLRTSCGIVAVAAHVSERQTNSVHMRQVFDDGSLGPVTILADDVGVGRYSAAASGIKDRIAVVWNRDGVTRGGLFAPDGRKTLDFQPVPDDGGIVQSFHTVKMAALGDGRLLSVLGGAVYDLRTGKAQALPSFSGASVAAPAGRGRAALIYWRDDGISGDLDLVGIA